MKKTLSVILSLMMLLSVFSVSAIPALAADTNQPAKLGYHDFDYNGVLTADPKPVYEEISKDEYDAGKIEQVNGYDTYIEGYKGEDEKTHYYKLTRMKEITNYVDEEKANYDINSKTIKYMENYGWFDFGIDTYHVMTGEYHFDNVEICPTVNRGIAYGDSEKQVISAFGNGKKNTKDFVCSGVEHQGAENITKYELDYKYIGMKKVDTLIFHKTFSFNKFGNLIHIKWWVQYNNRRLI